jgi:hypothetical protein
VRAQDKGFGVLEALAQEALDGPHGLEKAPLIPF